MDKYSKKLNKSNRSKMWGFYSKDKRGAKDFEEFCSFVVKAKEKLISKSRPKR